MAESKGKVYASIEIQYRYYHVIQGDEMLDIVYELVLDWQVAFR